MTRKDLIEKVAKSICSDWGYLWDGDPEDYQVIAEDNEPYDDRPTKKEFRMAAETVVSLIYASIEKPTKEMQKSWSNISKPHTSTKDWRAMLSASPLAPKEEVTTYNELSFADRVNMEYKEFIKWCDANPSFDLDCRLHAHSGKIGKGGYISDEKTRIAFAAWRAAKNALATSPLAPDEER